MGAAARSSALARHLERAGATDGPDIAVACRGLAATSSVRVATSTTVVVGRWAAAVRRRTPAAAVSLPTSVDARRRAARWQTPIAGSSTTAVGAVSHAASVAERTSAAAADQTDAACQLFVPLAMQLADSSMTAAARSFADAAAEAHAARSRPTLAIAPMRASMRGRNVACSRAALGFPRHGADVVPRMKLATLRRTDARPPHGRSVGGQRFGWMTSTGPGSVGFDLPPTGGACPRGPIRKPTPRRAARGTYACAWRRRRRRQTGRSNDWRLRTSITSTRPVAACARRVGAADGSGRRRLHPMVSRRSPNPATSAPIGSTANSTFQYERRLAKRFNAQRCCQASHCIGRQRAIRRDGRCCSPMDAR